MILKSSGCWETNLSTIRRTFRVVIAITLLSLALRMLQLNNMRMMLTTPKNIMGKISEIRQAPEDPVVEQQIEKINKTAVLIMTNPRSGSTYLGEFFNQNPDAYYLFEPLFPYTTHCSKLGDERIEYLFKMFRCDFSSQKNDYRYAFNVTQFTDKYSMCLSRNLCFPSRHQPILNRYAEECILGSIPTSLRVDLNQTSKNKKIFTFSPKSPKCGYPLNMTLIGKVCKQADIVATKVIRLCSIESIEPLYRNLTKSGYDVLVIHLVRDPRAVLSSHLATKLNGINSSTVGTEAEHLCKMHRQNLDYVENMSLGGYISNIESLITNKRYVRIRYEDMVQNVTEHAENIYKLLQRRPPQKLKNWLVETLQDKRQLILKYSRESALMKKGKGNKEKYLKLKKAFFQIKSPFGTIRDPKEILSKWRKLLPFHLVGVIQTKCKDVMDKLGYELFSSYSDAINFSKPSFV